MLCILAAPFFFITSLYLHQYQLKKTAYSRLKQERIVCLTFSYAQAKNVKPGSEIKVNGKMMDVQAISRLQDKIRVYGYYDEEEDELNDQLASVMNQQNNNNDDQSIIKIWQLFMMPYTHQPDVYLQHFTINSSQLYISFTATITTIYLPVATPPPLV